MPREKKDPSTATASYNIKSVERAIGFTTALINSEHAHHESLTKAAEQYTLSPLESAMVYVETVNLIAPQFRDGQNVAPVVAEIIAPVPTAIANYTLAEIEASKAEVKTATEASKQRRIAAKQ
jgi:hypothetical protein